MPMEKLRSQSQLKRLQVQKPGTVVWGIECPKCKEQVWSRHRHDFRYCGCKAVFVDGGRDYLRSGGEVFPKRVLIYVGDE